MKKIIIEELPRFPLSEIIPLLAERPYFSFLDSGDGVYRSNLGRYSFLAVDPFLVMKNKGKLTSIVKPKKRKIENKKENPFNALKKILSSMNIGPTPSYLPPFLGGGIGYLSYDLCHFIEKIPSTTKDDINIPDLFIAFYDRVLIIDHLLKKIFLAAILLPGETGPLKKKLEEFKKTLLKPKSSNPLKSRKKSIYKNAGIQNLQIKSNFTKYNYLKAVEKAKEYIAAGDIYQVNLSQRLQTELNIHPFRLYQRLRTINPAPFAAYLNFGEVIVASSSPERFLKVIGRKVQTRPIKGTRPRGRNKEEDDRLAKQLLESEKDRAELIMIVDLERNDLGKVCRYGSVRVKELVKLEVYPTVFHTVSTVEGELYPGKDRIDLLKATFPGGSITGAPKIRSMEIIDELEPTKRSVYTGNLGYFGFNGTMDLNIVIRTFLIKNKKAYFQVGGGIVADSEPEKEYQETMDKAKALIQSLYEGEKNEL
ncbi:aminodeoxychorismate synthase component I [Candidatus Aerophobetes bacterium]|nr:aminodeoxychorismate synthase component I [Candidatus Aerophobetes bacterium]